MELPIIKIFLVKVFEPKAQKAWQNGMPRVTHILFYTAFILANYSASLRGHQHICSCILQIGRFTDSFNVHQSSIIVIHQRPCRFCSRVILLSISLSTLQSIMMCGVSLVIKPAAVFGLPLQIYFILYIIYKF